MSDVPAAFADARERLRPVLRPLSAPANLWRALAADPGRAPIRRPFGTFFHALVAVDLDDRRVFVTPRHLDRWGVTAEAAFGAAFAALDPTAGLHLRHDGLWALAAGDGYEAARLLLPGWLDAFAPRVVGAPIAVAGHARQLLVCGAGDPRKVEALLEAAVRGFVREGEPIAPVPFCVRDGRLATWTPDADDPHAAVVRLNHHALARREYDAQGERLAEDGVAAAPYRVGASPDGRSFSFVRWFRDDPAWLPETDHVVVQDGDRVLVVAPFPDVLASCGDALRPTDAEPPRWAPLGFPTTDTLARLRERAVPADALGG